MGTRKNNKKSNKRFRKTKKRQRGGDNIDSELLIMSENAPPDDDAVEQITKLLDRGADVNAINIYENTPLILAVENVGEVECGDDTDLTEYKIVRLLLEKGANVNAENIYGHTALYLTENKYIQKLLRDNGAKLSEKDKEKIQLHREISAIDAEGGTEGPTCGVCRGNKYLNDGYYYQPVSFNNIKCKEHIFHRICVGKSCVKNCPLCRDGTKDLTLIPPNKLLSPEPEPEPAPAPAPSTGGKRKARKSKKSKRKNRKTRRK